MSCEDGEMAQWSGTLGALQGTRVVPLSLQEIWRPPLASVGTSIRREHTYGVTDR